MVAIIIIAVAVFIITPILGKILFAFFDVGEQLRMEATMGLTAVTAIGGWIPAFIIDAIHFTSVKLSDPFMRNYNGGIFLYTWGALLVLAFIAGVYIDIKECSKRSDT